MRRLPVTVLMAAALGTSACAPSVVFNETVCRVAPGEAHATSGFVPLEMERRPYERTTRTVLSLDDPDHPVDARGVVHQEWPGHEGSVYHPVHLAQYGLAMVESHRAGGESEHLDRAISNAEELLAGATWEGESLWFPYLFDYRLKGDDSMALPAPWYSGMAQGQALSLMTRLYEETGDDRWLTAAEGVFAAFTPEFGDSTPAFSRTAAGCLWFEEYVAEGLPPTAVVNGHIYAVFGLYDYARLTGDTAAIERFDAGATTALQTFGSYRVPGRVSYYCADHYCAQTRWQPEDYHRGVAAQLRDLAEMTGEQLFASQAELLMHDYRVTGATG